MAYANIVNSTLLGEVFHAGYTVSSVMAVQTYNNSDKQQKSQKTNQNLFA